VPAPAAAPPELFKLALSIDTPITERSAKPPARTASASPSEVKPALAGKVSKRERPSTAAGEAETLFRHGVALLNQRRISEAQSDFSAALFRQPEHEASRQALIAIRIERRQLDEARRLLEEGLALNPAQTQFAAVLARLHVERGDYHTAAAVLAAAGGTSPDDAEFQLVRGAVLQRLGRHAEAAESFEHAARLGNQSGTTLVALGISLEATGRKADALKAYRRSLAAPMAQEARSYAENRIRALD
jgi:MSHA biogenesis protein MshN